MTAWRAANARVVSRPPRTTMMRAGPVRPRADAAAEHRRAGRG